MSEPNLQEIHDFLISVAHKAGEMITSAHPQIEEAGSKKNSSDLVTETDRAVEEMVASSLQEKYPSYDFMGEETYKPGDILSDRPTFVCDPIDGTANFVHSHPQICISLGLSVNRTPSVGVVYNPFTQTLYTAIKGQGAFMNKTYRLPLRSPQRLNSLSQCLVTVEWGSDRSGNDFVVKHNTFAKLAASKEDGGAMVHSLRSLGSAALNICTVARGDIDVYWEGGCWAWDVCAGWVILKEAGGLMVDGNPGNWEPRIDERRYLAVRAGEGQKEIVEEFWGHVVGRLEVGI